MNTFKKKSLHVAVLSGLAAIGAAGTAEAVHINPDGTGQVLIFPYYTVRNNQATLISLVNTQNNTKAVKVRFLEGKNSKEVLDFNLFLSPSDVWTGALVQTAAGAKIISNDNSCVTPYDLFNESRAPENGLLPNDFKNYGYTGGFSDSTAWPTLDRTREGYFEVIEMGVIDDNTIDGDAIVGATAALVTGYIKHNAADVPANCIAVEGFDNYAGNTQTTRFPNTGTTPASVPGSNALLQNPRGGLAGRASIISTQTGSNYTFSATAFDQWNASAAPNYQASGDLFPAISEVNSGASAPISNVFTQFGVVTTTWTNATGGRDAMSATMMRNTVINEYVLDAGSASQTDWVVTFPTKKFYVANGTGAAAAPFANNFPNTTTGACDPYGVAVFNREERIPQSAVTRPSPSPQPPSLTIAGTQLCWEANVVPFGTTSLLASTNTNPLVSTLATFVNSAATSAPGPLTTPSIRSTQGPNGFMVMSFNGAVQQLLAPAGQTTRTQLGGAPTVLAGQATYFGMPVIGAMLHNYQNAGVVSRYGGVVEHRYDRRIAP